MEENDLFFHDKKYTDMWGINSNEEMIFYYDESNNCRRFLLIEDKQNFNTDIDADFVIAGVCCDKEISIGFDEIVSRFSLQPNIKELKSKSFWSGKDFIQCVGTKQVTALVKLIDDYNLFVHYQHVNNFFYTIVEILDSISNPEEIYEFGFDYFALKATLYKMLKRDVTAVSAVFLKYAYPNIKTKDIRGFCNDLLAILGDRREQKPDEKFVTGMLKRAANSEELTFIQNNEDYIMQDNFAEFYANNILQYRKSMHYYDEELSIQDKVKDYVHAFDKNINNFEFIDSKTNSLIQVSDLVAGLFGRLFTYVNNHECKDFMNVMPTLNDRQLTNMCSIQRLRIKSNERDRGFLHSLTAISEWRKVDELFELAVSEMQKRKDI